MNKFKILGMIIGVKSRLITAIILGGLVIVIVILFNPQIIPLLLATLLIYEVIIYGTYLLINIETRKAIKELEVECDPEKFLSRVNKMVTYIKSPKSMRNWILINKTAGLSETGNYDDGINLLKQINANELGYIYRALYYNNIASCYINKFLFQKAEKTLIELAEDNLSQLLKIIDNEKTNKKYIVLFQNVYNLNKIYLDMCKGKYEMCIEQLEAYYAKTEQVRLKIICRFGIGYCYYMSNNKSQSKEHFDYVINSGPKLYMAQQALKYIDEMK